ncbi:hypothetical protein SPZE110945_01605 [Sphingomonas zeae]|jgi:hypothetical protein
MPNIVASIVPTIDANDMTALIAGLQSCLVLADRLELPMVAIHIEQAVSWMIDHGQALDVAPPADSVS